MKTEYNTPIKFFERLDREFNFTLDAAATKENALVSNYYTIEDDALKQPWPGMVWCNPPYSQLELWAEKADDEAYHRSIYIFMLVPAYTDTKWWETLVCSGNCDAVLFIKGRLSPARFPSALVILSKYGGYPLTEHSWDWKLDKPIGFMLR